ncbi:MAG TPA: cytochrome ubiquinol oxidase subunit I, partial [Gammaproteobacteria bacterium]|nr:cytochrome ubiquinol oxidase subunit I [Gammaproteobacteria bacterium]
VPNVPVVFWTFRIMVLAGFIMIFLFAAAMYVGAKGRIGHNPWLLRLALWSIPLPWVAAELGWITAEMGRQPWAIGEVLPTGLASSSHTAGQLFFSLGGLVLFYSALAVVELWLMITNIRKGPASLGTGRYHGESGEEEAGPHS